MMIANVLRDLIFLFLFSLNDCSKIAFPSGATLPIHEEDVERFGDSQKTGSMLFRVGDRGVSDSKRLTLNIDVGSFRDKRFAYFRVHPAFMKCIQKSWSEVQNSGRKIQLKQGYKLTTGSTKQDIYSRAGTGIRLGFDPTEPKKSFTQIAVALLRHCPAVFAPLGLDLGLIIEPDSVFAFMTGHATPSKWTIEAEGENPDFKAIGNLRKWAREKMNDLTQPKSVPKCSIEFTDLALNEKHPTDASLDFVGPPDRPVLRSSPDLLRLVQFPSDNVMFPKAASCPEEGGYLGHGATTRCAPRLMAPRLFLCLNKLQRMAHVQLKVALKVAQGWAEDAKGLRAEGREVLVSSDSAAVWGKVARLAVCAGCDYVAHEAGGVRLAVMKQLSLSSSPISFPSAQIVPVAAPDEEWVANYQLRSDFDNSDYPLLDGALARNVSDGVPLSLFKSKDPDIRYMRLHPAIVKCFKEIERWENREQPSTKVALKITQAFMSVPQERSLMSPVIDERLDTHTLGIGLQVAYKNPDAAHTVWRLAETIASVCPLVFKTQEDDTVVGQAIGIGIYKTDVHLDMRHKMNIWFECENCDLKPPGGAKSYHSSLAALVTNSANNRLIDPSDFQVACKFDNSPALQSPSFFYKEAEAEKRVRRSTSASPECQMNAPMDTFCRQSLQARKAEVDKVWKIISYKHLFVAKPKILQALNGCLLSCSKCSSGPQWGAKMLHCSNLIHWLPFTTQNAATDVRSNFYARGDKEAENRACENGEHCVVLSPLAALFSDSLWARFRPIQSKPNSEMIYDPLSNPSPLPVLIGKLYAFSAQGEVKIFLRNDAHVIGMSSSLKTLFLYNKAVTKVRIFVLDPSSINVVVAALEANLEEWRTNGCPRTSRRSLTPYTVEAAPQVNSEAPAYKERHRVRDLWEKWSSGFERSDFL